MCIWIELFLLLKSHQIQYFPLFTLHRYTEKHAAAQQHERLPKRKKKKKNDGCDVTLEENAGHAAALTHINTRARTHTNARTHPRSDQCDRGARGVASRNFCRKPEVAYRTITPPTPAFHRPPEGQRSSARRCFPDWLAWARTVCQERKEKKKRKREREKIVRIQNQKKEKKTLATEFGGFSPDASTV